MIRWIVSLFAWRTVWDSGIRRYQQNGVTGLRRVRTYGAGYQPIDLAWLYGGGRSRPPTHLPSHARSAHAQHK